MSEVFGEFEGRPVHRVRISNDRLTADILTWGAVVQDLRLDGHPYPLTLGFETFEPYPTESPYFGSVPGRVANRIRNARAPLDGRIIELEPNTPGGHQLHGGPRGFGKSLWSIVDHGPAHVTLEIVSPDGDMGYPGTLTARCTYRLASGTLRCEFEAEADAPTFANLTHHSYFNLEDGGRTAVTDHRLRMAASAYLDIDEDFVSQGDPILVEGTRFDFRTMRSIRMGDGEQPIWDHNMCLSDTRVPMRDVAWVEAPSSGVSMTVSTTEPGLQFYTGHRIATRTSGLEGIAYGPRSGLCLEPQCWPDAPNNPSYPSIEVRPDEPMTQIVAYSFLRT